MDASCTPRVQEDNEVVLNLFRAAWYEYFSWEPLHCSEKLSSIRAHHTLDRDARLVVLNSLEDDSPANIEESDGARDTDTALSFTYYDLSSSHEPEHRPIRPEVVPAVDTLPAPYPFYESCTPINANILHGDDPNYLPFIPFADDPTFDYRDYMYDHKGLAWQEGYRDSDGAQARFRVASSTEQSPQFSRLF